jgi:hypothetical protein
VLGEVGGIKGDKGKADPVHLACRGNHLLAAADSTLYCITDGKVGRMFLVFTSGTKRFGFSSDIQKKGSK